MDQSSERSDWHGPPVSTRRAAVGTLQRLAGSRSVPWLALGLALAVLAATVGLGALYLRRHVREHFVQHDGQILYNVALARQYANGSGADLTRRLGNPADQLALALEISQLRDDVLAVRLFDRDGHFVTAFPPNVTATNLDAGELAVIKGLQPISRFHDHARLEDYFWLAPDSSSNAATTPLLEVNIPLHSRSNRTLVAAAQLLLDGHAVTREYARVDEHLWWLAGGLYAGGATLLTGVLMWAYRRLHRAHTLLAERTTRLLRANHELALAAKTSALGSVTAHLIHGLSNPLANLQDFIAGHAGNGKPEGDLTTVAAATRRMQQLVHDVVRVLGEERGGEHYQLSLAELVDVLNVKLGPAVQDSGVYLVTELNASGNLSNRHANLVLLILENLIHNALKVTPAGRNVCVRFFATDDGVGCEVQDQGPGISIEIFPRLFTPCRSTHGGSGLGLAISKQLANQLGADLSLKSTSERGCVFVLRLPWSVFAETEIAA